MINASHDTSTPQPWWAKLTSLRAAAAPRIGLATLVMLFVLACEPPSPSDIAFERWHDGNSEIYGMSADGSGQTRLTNNGTVSESVVIGGGLRKGELPLELEVTKTNSRCVSHVHYEVCTAEGRVQPQAPWTVSEMWLPRLA